MLFAKMLKVFSKMQIQHLHIRPVFVYHQEKSFMGTWESGLPYVIKEDRGPPDGIDQPPS